MIPGESRFYWTHGKEKQLLVLALLVPLIWFLARRTRRPLTRLNWPTWIRATRPGWWSRVRLCFDDAGFGLLLRRDGRQEAHHFDDAPKLRGPRRDQRVVGAGRIQLVLRRQPRWHCGRPEDVLGVSGRGAQPQRGLCRNGAVFVVRPLPAQIRHHHPRSDHWQHGGTRALPRVHFVHGPVRVGGLPAAVPHDMAP